MLRLGALPPAAAAAAVAARRSPASASLAVSAWMTVRGMASRSSKPTTVVKPKRPAPGSAPATSAAPAVAPAKPTPAPAAAAAAPVKPPTPTPAPAVPAYTPPSSSSSSYSGSSSSTSTSNSSSATPDMSAAFKDSSMSKLLSNPTVRAQLADPKVAAQMQALMSNPAQLDSMLNSRAFRMAAGAMGGEGMKAALDQMRDPAIRAQMMAQLQQPGQVDSMLQAARQEMDKQQGAAPVASTPPPPPPPPPARPTPPPAASKPTPPPPPPPASEPVDNNFASMLRSNPEAASALSDPAKRAQLQALLADPARLDAMLANPMVRRGLAMAGGKEAEAMLNSLADPAQRASLVQQLNDMSAPEKFDAIAQETQRQIDRAKAANEAAAAASARAAAAEAAALAAAPPTPPVSTSGIRAPRSAPVTLTASTDATPATASGSAGGLPPPPPPSSSSSVAAAASSPSPASSSVASPAASTDSGSGSGSGSGSSSSSSSAAPPSSDPAPTLFSRLIDLVLGAALGYSLFELGRFLLDRPALLDSVAQAAEEDALVQMKLGTPLVPGWLWTGNVGDDSAQVVIPVSGPKGSGILHARALWDRHSKSWKMMLLQVELDGLPQKHSLLIPDRFVIKPRYVSPEEAERIRLRYEAMAAKMAEKHGGKNLEGQALPSFLPAGAEVKKQ